MATASSCPVIATTEDQILECVAMRLRAEIPEYGQANCIVTEEAIPEHDNTTGDVICTVTHGTSSFDQDLWEGGGPRHTIENLLVLVTPMVRLLTDKPGEATQLFGSNERGLLRRYKRMVLSALLSDRGGAVVPHQRKWLEVVVAAAPSGEQRRARPGNNHEQRLRGGVNRVRGAVCLGPQPQGERAIRPRRGMRWRMESGMEAIRSWST